MLKKSGAAGTAEVTGLFGLHGRYDGAYRRGNEQVRFGNALD